ncbi:hypothetical protein DPMN_024931 [Dreissena polymorpha]|uniref:Uncharacterized protein n=1 Tax=Dreissena polymorpha TaxID=45954 RepID=A0A9D4LQP9_DREPO|nr:hypothetical protein DPMN_024931 [Dreissena polymorpha]
MIYSFANKNDDNECKALNTLSIHENCDNETMLPIMWYEMERVPVRDEYYSVIHFVQ